MNTTVPQQVKEAIKKRFPYVSGNTRDIDALNVRILSERQAAEFGYKLSVKSSKEDEVVGDLGVEASADEGASVASHSSGSSNSIEQERITIEMVFELGYTQNKKNEAVKWSRFDEALELREKENQLRKILDPIYDKWVKENHPESEPPMDEKDKEILRLRGIIKKLQSEQNPERSATTGLNSSTTDDKIQQKAIIGVPAPREPENADERAWLESWRNYWANGFKTYQHILNDFIP